MKVSKPLVSDRAEWLDNNFNFIDDCKRNSRSSLSLRQPAVYGYLGLQWSLFADCDRQHEEKGQLDDAGELRRNNFLRDESPLSSNTLKPVLERVAGRTFASCIPKRTRRNPAADERR